MYGSRELNAYICFSCPRKADAQMAPLAQIYPRSILWKTTKCTAICIQLADEYWTKVNEVRLHHDKDFDHWCIPTIRLTREFFTADKLWEAAGLRQSVRLIVYEMLCLLRLLLPLMKVPQCHAAILGPRC